MQLTSCCRHGQVGRLLTALSLLDFPTKERRGLVPRQMRALIRRYLAIIKYKADLQGA